MRVAPPDEISAEERTTLDDWANGRQTEVRAAERARVILPAADGKPNLEIDTTLSTSVQQAAHWRWRFLAKDLPGLEKNAPRPRRFPSIASQKVAEVVRLTTLDKPAHATYWSNRSVANKVGMLRYQRPPHLPRPWLNPHLSASFEVSNDPHFAKKLEAVVRRYLSPPEHALVVCVSEKS